MSRKSIVLAASELLALGFFKSKSMTHVLRNFVLMLGGIGLLVWPNIARANDPMIPELRIMQFFPIELNAGDHLVYNGPNDSLTVEGPAVLNWIWESGSLFCESSVGSIRVRPLEEFTSQPMTPEMIERARGHFLSVPFIKEQLAGIDNPTNEIWATAYQEWLSSIRSLERSHKLSFQNSNSFNQTAVAAAIAVELNNNNLVVPGSATVADPGDPNSDDRDIWLTYMGVPPHEDGTPDQWVIMLRTNFQEHQTPASSISREDALRLHHAIYIALESSSSPLLVDLSAGVSIVTLEGRQKP